MFLSLTPFAKCKKTFCSLLFPGGRKRANCLTNMSKNFSDLSQKNSDVCGLEPHVLPAYSDIKD